MKTQVNRIACNIFCFIGLCLSVMSNSIPNGNSFLAAPNLNTGIPTSQLGNNSIPQKNRIPTSQLTILQNQIEEKRRLLMNLYSNQLQQKPVQQMVANTIQEPPQRNFSVINTTVIEEKIDSLKSENSKILKEIKPLLKSLIDMQYYTYQSINKVNADIKVLKDEVDGLRKNFMIEEDNIKKPRQIKDELKESSPKNVKEEKKFEDSSSRERTEERKGNRIEDETTYIKMPKTPSLFEP